MSHISDQIMFEDFLKIDIRVGTVVDVKPFPEARKPAWQIWVDFGANIGIKKSSAQITAHYKPEMLMGMQIAGVVNFPARQIGPFRSEFLTLGFTDENGDVVLIQPERPVPNGGKLH